MGPIHRINNQKGEAVFSYIVVGILIAVGAIIAMNHYQGRNRDITIHLPKVEVR